MRNTKTVNWLIAISYVLILYATLGVARVPITFLRSKGLLTLTIIVLSILVAGGIFFALARKQALQWWRVLSLLGIVSLLYFAAGTIRAPEEKLHFLEYALVGIFFFRAIKPHLEYNWKSFSLAFGIGCLAGGIDELIQRELPNRVFDWNDIFLNCFSVAIGLAILSIFPKQTRG